jgi:hypothetical protein
MSQSRLLRPDEKSLLAALISKAHGPKDLVESLSNCRVEEMSDGGMGSLRFSPQDGRPRLLGERLLDAEFADVDGVPIMVRVNLDDCGELYELDIWKVDFSPVVQFPSVGEV